MILNPQKIIEHQIIEDIGDGRMECQMNGIDLTIDQIQLINGGALGKNSRYINDYTPLEPIDGWYALTPNQSYSISFQQRVDIPSNVCAIITHRSTLNRIGGFITSGIYDSGFKNQLGAVLRTTNNLTIECGARIAQIVFYAADSASLYDGIYQGEVK